MRRISAGFLFISIVFTKDKATANGQVKLKGWLASMKMTVKMAMWQLTPRRHKGGHLASVRSSAEEKLLQELVLARYSVFLSCRVYLVIVAGKL